MHSCKSLHFQKIVLFWFSLKFGKRCPRSEFNVSNNDNNCNKNNNNDDVDNDNYIIGLLNQEIGIILCIFLNYFPVL